MSTPRWFGGVDENGLGPRLGPLVVTGVLARAETDEAAALVQGPASRAFDELIGDSKRLVAFGHSGLGEAWARVLCQHQGIKAREPKDLVEALTLDPLEELQRACPHSALPLCWGRAGQVESSERFEADDELIDRVHRLHEKLASRGILVELARSAIVCTQRINAARDEGRSRLDLDLEAMERLFLTMRERTGRSLRVHCGKVGGLTFYAPRFRHLRIDALGILREGSALSCYRSGGAELCFVIDAEPKHQLVALASLIGKWLRDLLMNRLLTHLRRTHPDWPRASGYNDPVTKRLIALSEAWRSAEGIPEACFLRR
ncbi:MAG: hypothetical protein LBM75_05605 [Myxococcales bacterium]|jgi:ribonuclease HII|nr:hypothetical protein [Myxococcales bacterium]